MENQNQDLISAIETFLKFDKNTDIKIIHGLIGKDLDISNLHLQYMDLSNSSDEIKKQPMFELLTYLLKPERIEFFLETATIIARICACTPNSAYYERVISANNNLKTNKRMSLLISTENNYYLYIHFNVPVLENWNARPAVSKYLAD